MKCGAGWRAKSACPPPHTHTHTHTPHIHTAHARSVGGAQFCLDYAHEYSRGRRQFGRPLSDFQATQFKLADMQTAVQASRLMVGSERRCVCGRVGGRGHRTHARTHARRPTLSLQTPSPSPPPAHPPTSGAARGAGAGRARAHRQPRRSHGQAVRGGQRSHPRGPPACLRAPSSSSARKPRRRQCPPPTHTPRFTHTHTRTHTHSLSLCGAALPPTLAMG